MAFLRKHRRAGLILLVGMAIIAVVVVVAMFWKQSYLVLPEPVVIQAEEEGGPEPPAVAAGIDRFDVLLLGLDAREDDPSLGERTDTIMLLTVDVNAGYASILSIPRDTRVRYDGKWHKINEVYSIDGAQGSVDAVEELLNMRIDRYAVVDFHGVIELVDLLGGIVVDVPVDMYKPLENIDLKKGPAQQLNGYDALAYMRYRDERLSDMDRSERQKEVLLQLANRLMQPINLLKLASITEAALQYIQTDISTQEIMALASFGKSILSVGVENRVLPGINDLYLGGWYYVPFLEEIGLPMGEAEIEYRAYLAEREAEEAAAAAEAEAEAETVAEAEAAAEAETEAETAAEAETETATQSTTQEAAEVNVTDAEANTEAAPAATAAADTEAAAAESIAETADAPETTADVGDSL